MWRRPDRTEILDTRDTAEEEVAAAAARSLRRFLRDASAAATAALDTPAMVAAGTPSDPITLGTFQRFWTTAYTTGALSARIRDAWTAGFRIQSDRVILSGSADAFAVYMNQVSDRLVRGLYPPIADGAFDLVRVTITQAGALGWDRRTTSQRLAAELGWEQHAPYWRTQLDHTNSAIDSILDPLGSPGAPARELARLHDPKVRALQADRSTIVRRLDGEASQWEVRAARIATTETTGAYGAASTYALQQEGVRCKEWLTARDARVRPEHADADGQTVEVGMPFSIGGYMANHPGAESLPPELSVNCRCCVVGGVCD